MADVNLMAVDVDSSHCLDDCASHFGTYVMKAVCHNCHEGLTVRFAKTHRTRAVKCPFCGVYLPLGMSFSELVETVDA